ncbi:formimidoylglutamate deiminase [Mesorhizobium sp. RP14(2022)]|uniref:Formimidoylglutamate deiminase n=1 Tax=Mesorhizobium liriopis TaxID=2953882 RepID=A0ABT1C945_9HYPH|nr:formimidoylglutamate deiminase [Mesorhizobium liriopis]MCO6051356.1 formimidoylglutamate deiminase [Mesorhizobium liriopis]
MLTLHARSALLRDGWADGVRITVSEGRIATMETGVGPVAGDERAEVLVPAITNLHSHAFQRAMAGLAERRGPGADSFWSWREVMYRFALRMTPEQLEAVAALLYVEMLEAGFGRVGEFHYLHHAPDGGAYDDVAELAVRIAAASHAAGIGLTLLPVFYNRSGFGGAAPVEGQRRFVNTPDRFARLVEASRKAVDGLEGAVVGIAPHSLRAATPDELMAILPLAGDGPVHIHVAEQQMEVADCLAWSGARPVEWLLGHAPVDRNWCLIHATHIENSEIRGMLASGAIAGLCPITEANLGDGIFSAKFLEGGGAWGVGSDSNIEISLVGELRQLEYSQRLALKARNVLAAPGGSTGAALFNRALEGGARALGVSHGIAVGSEADLVALNTEAAPHVTQDALLDHWIFAGRIGIDRVWVRGRLLVEDGRHVARKRIEARFHEAMAALSAAA